LAVEHRAAALLQFGIPRRSSLIPAVELDHDPELADGEVSVEEKYCEVQNRVQRGMDDPGR
jgi:hypothetical protein